MLRPGDDPTKDPEHFERRVLSGWDEYIPISDAIHLIIEEGSPWPYEYISCRLMMDPLIVSICGRCRYCWMGWEGVATLLETISKHDWRHLAKEIDDDVWVDGFRLYAELYWTMQDIGIKNQFELMRILESLGMTVSYDRVKYRSLDKPPLDTYSTINDGLYQDDDDEEEEGTLDPNTLYEYLKSMGPQEMPSIAVRFHVSTETADSCIEELIQDGRCTIDGIVIRVKDENNSEPEPMTSSVNIDDMDPESPDIVDVLLIEGGYQSLESIVDNYGRWNKIDKDTAQRIEKILDASCYTIKDSSGKYKAVRYNPREFVPVIYGLIGDDEPDGLSLEEIINSSDKIEGWPNIISVDELDQLLNKWGITVAQKYKFKSNCESNSNVENLIEDIMSDGRKHTISNIQRSLYDQYKMDSTTTYLKRLLDNMVSHGLIARISAQTYKLIQENVRTKVKETLSKYNHTMYSINRLYGLEYETWRLLKIENSKELLAIIDAIPGNWKVEKERVSFDNATIQDLLKTGLSDKGIRNKYGINAKYMKNH